MDSDHFEITKELHLSQLHNPYANALNEHYCRRWISIKSIKHIAGLLEIEEASHTAGRSADLRILAHA